MHPTFERGPVGAGYIHESNPIKPEEVAAYVEEQQKKEVEAAQAAQRRQAEQQIAQEADTAKAAQLQQMLSDKEAVRRGAALLDAKKREHPENPFKDATDEDIDNSLSALN